MSDIEIIKMTTNYKSLAFLLVCTVSNSLSAQTAEFDAASGYLTIPLLKLGADVYEQVRFQYDGELDFNVVDFAKKTESDAKTNATFDGSTLDLKVVKVGEAVYSNLEFAFQPPLKFSITKVQEPLSVSNTSFENRKSKLWVNFLEIRNQLHDRDEYIAEHGSFSGYDGRAFLDIDLDGDDDIFVAGIDYRKPYILETYGDVPSQLWINQGDGEFKLDENEIIEQPPRVKHIRKIITADFNGDKYPDIVLADQGFDAPPFPGADLKIIMSSIDGTYETHIISDEGFHHGVTAGDFDGDGDVDLFSVAAAGGGLFLNDGGGNFISNNSLSIYNYQQGFFNTISTDVNGDGRDDIILLPDERREVMIIYQGTDGFSDLTVQELPVLGGYGTINDIGFTDLNSDGIADAVISATGDRNSVYYKGNAVYGVLLGSKDNSISVVPIYRDEDFSEDWVRFILVNDLNNDGFDDIYSEDRSHNFILLGDGGGRFEKKYAYISPEFRSYDLKFDLNNDGYQDVITRFNFRNSDKVTYGSSEEFIDKDERYLELSPVPDFTSTFKFAVGDLNSDGNSDLVVTATNTSTGSNVGCAVGIHFLVGKQLDRYETIYSNQDSGFCYEAKVADIDYDGDLDITTQIYRGANLSLINDGEGRFTLSD